MRASRVILGVVAAAVFLAVSGGVYAGSATSPGGHWGHSAGPTYNVTFHETGLPTGTYWSISISGHWGWGGHHLGRGRLTSNTTSIVVPLPNGTYRYQVHPVPGFVFVSGQRGNFTVNGSSPAVISVVFGKPVTYAVTFTETGLASGTNWTVRVLPVGGWPPGPYARHVVQTTSGTSMTFNLPNGTYFYHVSRVRGYTFADNSSFGKFNVTGAAVSIAVKFQPIVTYTVTFTESGLPSGTNWTVAVFSWGRASSGTGGLHAIRANTTSITFKLANGTYYFHVHARGYTATANGTGTFNVTGASPPTIKVTFTPDAYPGSPTAAPAPALALVAAPQAA